MNQILRHVKMNISIIKDSENQYLKYKGTWKSMFQILRHLEINIQLLRSVKINFLIIKAREI